VLLLLRRRCSRVIAHYADRVSVFGAI
jgi:hypothetical protein